MSRLLLENADFVLTVDPEDRVLDGASLVVSDGVIEAVGAAEEIAADYADVSFDEVISGRNRLVAPGLVDSHLHLSEQLSRSLFPDCLNTRAWVFNWAKPFYAAVHEEDEYLSALTASIEMIRSGTTCFLDMGAQTDPGETIRALDEIGIRGITGRHAADRRPDRLPPHWTQEMVERHFFQNTDEAVAELRRCIEQWNNSAGGRVHCWANIEGKEPCTPELHVRSRALAEELGVGTTYHIATSIEEARVSERKYGLWPVERISQMGGLGANLVLAHAVALKDYEVGLLAESGAKVAFCPGTSLKLAKGATRIGRYPELMESGVTIALGCDGTSAAGSLDMMRQMYLAAGLFKDARMNAELVSARQAIRLATIAGAQTLLWDDEIGSLEVGKRADLITFDLTDVEWTPCHDPEQAFVYSATPRSLRTVVIDGRIVLDEGTLTTVDEAEVLREAHDRARAIVERSGLVPGQTPVTTTAYD
ncbi:MAG: amidohydrolase family protein [Gaiellaceae bacterium]